MIRKVLFITTFILAAFAHHAHSQLKQVEYNITKDTFDKILPFDQPFNLKITGIDTTVDRINVDVYKLGWKGNGCFKKGTWGSTRIDKNCTVLSRDSNFASTSANVVIQEPLLPNRYYRFNMTMNTLRALSDAEKKALEKEIDNSGVVQTLFNKLGSIAITDYNKVAALNNEDKLLKEFNNQVSAIVSRIDSRYVFSSSNKSQLSTLHGFIEQIYNLQDIPGNMKTTLQNKRGESIDEPSFILGTTFSDNFELALKQTVWGSIQSSDANWKRLLDTTSLNPALKDAIGGLAEYSFEELGEVVNARKQMEAANLIKNVIIQHTFIRASVNTTFTDTLIGQARLQVTLDAGYAYAYNMDRFFGYVGANIYFRPIYKNLPLSNFKGFTQVMAIRSSLLLGMSLSSISKDNVRKGIIDDNKSLLVGMGFRLTPWFKLNAGSLFYYSVDPNPLIGNKKYTTSADPFVSLSIDFDVKPLFQGLGDALFKTQ